MPSTRRTVLAVGLAAVTAGCAELTGGPPTDPERPVFVRSSAEEFLAVDIRIWNEDTEETHLEETIELPAGESIQRHVELDGESAYGVEGSLETGARASHVREVDPRDGAAFRVDVEDPGTVDAMVYLMD